MWWCGLQSYLWACIVTYLLFQNHKVSSCVFFYKAEESPSLGSPYAFCSSGLWSYPRKIVFLFFSLNLPSCNFEFNNHRWQFYVLFLIVTYWFWSPVCHAFPLLNTKPAVWSVSELRYEKPKSYHHCSISVFPEGVLFMRLSVVW